MKESLFVLTDGVELPARRIAKRIQSSLDTGQSVLWLVSGGSAIQLAVRTRALLGDLPGSAHLHVGLIDERFGEVNHSNSNAKQLLDAGFDEAGLTFCPVLTGKDIETTAQDYATTLETLVSQADSVLGIFGMGSDGHTAGLLPENPLMDSFQIVGHYDGPDYKRITITPVFIQSIDEVILYALGESKWPVLETFAITALPVAILRGAANLRIYTDYKELPV